MRLLMLSGDRQVAIGEKGPFFALQREFSRHFARIDVLCPRPDKPPSVFTIHDRVHLHPAPVGRARMRAWLVERGLELAREHRPSLIVSHDYGWFYNGLASARIARATGIPYLSELHHIPGHPVAADLRERFDKRVARAYVRWARERAAAFRVVNHIEMPELLASWGVPREKILVLPSLYIDLDVFHPPSEPVPHEQDLCFVGRMVNNKGLDRIVDAFALLVERELASRALFVGRGPLLAATKERVRAKGLADRVRFVEWVESPSDLAQIYRQSRVVVCASTCEGGPRFTVEAMACATPVVSTRVGVMGELLDGQNGSIAGFDVASLADRIGEVLADEAQRRAMGARAHADVQRFEYTRTIQNYADGVKRLAGLASSSA